MKILKIGIIVSLLSLIITNSLLAGDKPFKNVMDIEDGQLFYKIKGSLDESISDVLEFQKHFNFDAQRVEKIYIVSALTQESLAAADACAVIILKLAEKYHVTVDILTKSPFLYDFLKLGWEDGANINIFKTISPCHKEPPLNSATGSASFKRNSPF